MDATGILANYCVPDEMPIDIAGSFNSEPRRVMLRINVINDLWRLVAALHIIERQELSTEEIEFSTQFEELREVAEDLEDLYQFLTDRTVGIKIRFIGHGPRQQRLLEAKSRAPLVLFSGGLDSLAAAFSNVPDSHPSLFHAVTSNIVFSRALRLRNSHSVLSGDPIVFGDCRFSTLGGGFSQTRGLLFLSAAVNAASSLGINDIIIGENGPLMINPSVSPSSGSTKNAHPKLIADFQNILNRLGQSHFRILAVHRNMTKAEVMRRILGVFKIGEAISASNSCARTQGISAMCGLCFACFVRRTSLLSVGFQEADSVYQTDAFSTDVSKLGLAEVDAVNDLKDSLAYYKRFVLNSAIPLEWSSDLPLSYFNDSEGMLRRFAMDLFVGARNYIRHMDNGKRNALAEYCLDLIRQIGPTRLDAREFELTKEMTAT